MYKTSDSIVSQGILGSSPAVRQLIEQCERMAKSTAPILLIGPPGSEFESVASYIHSIGPRASAPFVRQRCISWQELTDPIKIVGKGTLFVEGIEHAPLTVQLKLLEEFDEARTLDRESINASQPRIIASTSGNLPELVASGLFLDDLYWYLCAMSISIPSLSQRTDDIPFIVRQLISEMLSDQSEEQLLVPAQTMQQLQSYAWPGNFRELRSRLQRAVVLAKDRQLQVELPAVPFGLQGFASQYPPSLTAHHYPGLDADRAADQFQTTANPVGSLGARSRIDSAHGDGLVPAPKSSSSDLVAMIEAVVRQGIKEADKAVREPYDYIVSRVEKALIVAAMKECENVQTKTAIRLGINRNTLHKKIKEYGLEES